MHVLMQIFATTLIKVIRW